MTRHHYAILGNTTQRKPSGDPTRRETSTALSPQIPLSELLRSTPARLLAVGVALLLGTLAVGLIASATVNERKQEIDTLLTTTEPLAQSTQNLYASLSVADAAAATAFLSGGVEPQAVRDTYTQAVGTAAAELVSTSDGLPGDDTSRRLLTQISTDLPVYTGLVETARTNNRAGNPMGGAYLAEASTLMQTRLLPLAEALHSERAAAATAPQSGFGRPLWTPIGLLVALLIAFVATQIVMARRTRRTLNPGLVFTTAMVAVLLAWMLIAGLVSATSAHRAVTEGSRPLTTLDAARILAQQARTEETLQLVRRDESENHARAFNAATTELHNLLDTYTARIGRDDVARASVELSQWDASHQRMLDALSSGDWMSAAAMTAGADPDSSAAQFSAVDGALTNAADSARAELRRDISRSSTVLSALGPGAVVLTVVAAIGIPVGLWPRLREYQ
ncbi:hypothetical protein [Rhodococcus sp. ABRD24]|uniref:hypothetical protein n=1 Tax=Rhodococcus sp. ABRD24 TaxID=2507582 RepID=UPI001A955F4C|nr:hypothetical protein [Rhodococcus sp. ABRD24]